MLSINLSNIESQILGNAENGTRGCWVRSKIALHCAMQPPTRQMLIVNSFFLFGFFQKSDSSLGQQGEKCDLQFIKYFCNGTLAGDILVFLLFFGFKCHPLYKQRTRNTSLDTSVDKKFGSASRDLNPGLLG